MARYWTPVQGYDLELSIGGTDLTRELFSCAILHSLGTYYPMFEISLAISPDDILLNKIYGQDPILLRIKLLGAGSQETSAPVLEDIQFSLLVLNSNFNMPITESSLNKDKQQTDMAIISFSAVPREPYKIMTAIINKIYLAKNMNGIISDMINTAGGNPKIDRSGLPSDIFDQIIIPPKSLIGNLKALNSLYGIHNGTTVIFCDHEKNVHVKNLTDRMNKKEAFQITQLSSGEDESKVVNDQNEEIYFTTQPIETNYDANMKLATISKINKFIIKPKDVLHYIKEVDVFDWAEQYGLKDGNGKLFSDVFLNNRTKYFMENSAWPYDKQDEFVEPVLIKNIANMSIIRMSINRYFNMVSLMKVGEAILFNTKVEQYLDISGKYILFSSELVFTKHTNWNSTANLTCIRTNRVKGQ